MKLIWFAFTLSVVSLLKCYVQSAILTGRGRNRRKDYFINTSEENLLRRFERDSSQDSFCSPPSRFENGSSARCCVGRSDECSMKYKDTMCYCDEFCHREKSSDCCPGYEGACVKLQVNYYTTKTPTTAQKIPSSENDLQSSTANIFTTMHTSKSITASSPRYETQTTSANTAIPLQTTTITNIYQDQSSFKVCYDNGEGYKLGDTIRRNCNKCVCKKLDYNGYYSFVCEENVCLVIPNMIEVINAGNYGWTASNYSFLWQLTLVEGMKNRLGTINPTLEVRNMTSLLCSKVQYLPSAFDSRVKWEGSITPPRDQGNCGSSWAFSTTSVASDRIAIQSQSKTNVELSPQELLSCKLGAKSTCGGGRVDVAWWHLRRKGLTSTNIYPYTSGTSKKIPTCMKNKTSYFKPRFKTGPVYRIARDEDEIMSEIYKNGPVQAVFQVHQDFFLYHSGVYKPLPFSHQTKEKYYHSVKIVGWGASLGPLGALENYWIVQNSWGSEWGEDGYFRISRGNDVSEIESLVLAAWAKIDS